MGFFDRFRRPAPEAAAAMPPHAAWPQPQAYAPPPAYPYPQPAPPPAYPAQAYATQGHGAPYWQQPAPVMPQPQPPLYPQQQQPVYPQGLYPAGPQPMPGWVPPAQAMAPQPAWYPPPMPHAAWPAAMPPVQAGYFVHPPAPHAPVAESPPPVQPISEAAPRRAAKAEHPLDDVDDIRASLREVRDAMRDLAEDRRLRRQA